MTRLGFLLDSGSCIGCHACTVACKSEHDVPLGVNRTWVKYVETGTFPDVARQFTVMRCNQCDDAPCMAICPTSALYRAPNGVVDFDDGNCIGCKACMNACPYDALYINPDTGTAHKCNMCNHRIEVGLEPSCQIVCPTEAIRIGDLDDPESEISRAAAEGLPVRSPEQNTRPKVYYRGVDEALLDPTASAIAGDGMIWADAGADHPTAPVLRVGRADRASADGAPADEAPAGRAGRAPSDEAPAGRADRASADGASVGRAPADEVPATARTAYTTAHPMPWKEKVSGYLVTKAVAAGVMGMAALLVVLGHGDSRAAVGVAPPVVAGLFLAATGVLLVGDLRQPRRFHYLLTRANWSSWLVKGAYVLMAFSVVCLLWLIAGLTGFEGLQRALILPVWAGAAGTAGYTAFLFAQCEGRDLWQTELLLPILLTQTATAGAAAFALLDLFIEGPAPVVVRWVLITGLVMTAGLTFAELFPDPDRSRNARVALRAMIRGRYALRFWLGGVVAGLVVPTGMTIYAVAAEIQGPALPAVAGALALAGMFAYEDAFVRAGQSAPLS